MRHGVGIFTSQDGSTYDGEWAADKRTGRGILRDDDGLLIDAVWRADKMEGRGSVKYPDGSVYTGTFKDNKKDGRGNYAYTNGAVYEGRFRGDAIEGMGTFKLPVMSRVSDGASLKDALQEENRSGSKKHVIQGPAVGTDGTSVMLSDDDEEWMMPINLSKDMTTIHYIAGFDKEGK